MTLRFCGALLAAVMAFAAPAAAQTEAEFVEAFAGDWVVHDDLYSVGGEKCQLSLSPEGSDGIYGVTVTSCALELGAVSGWRIVDARLALLVDGEPMALLGGTQIRVSGNSAIGAPIVLDRAGGSPLVKQLEEALAESGCYYLGFSSTCVDEAQLAKPAVPADGSGARINVLVNLNVREEARDESAVIGIVPANTCIVTDVCIEAADGVWCRAAFTDRSGWLKKVALRQERWPVITFVNQCPGASPAVATEP